VKISASLRYPLLDGAGLRGNVHADLDEVLAFLEFIWKHIAFVVNLLERVFSRTVHLELEKFLPALEIAVQCRRQQRLAETERTIQENYLYLSAISLT